MVMLKLFSSFVETPKRSALHDGLDKKYTRFAPRRVRETEPEAEASPCDTIAMAPKPVAALRPITRAKMALDQKFNDTAHLYADTRISVSVLHRALPERFSDMN
jgi:hypothetical protein